jgi:hypothetical protein
MNQKHLFLRLELAVLLFDVNIKRLSGLLDRLFPGIMKRFNSRLIYQETALPLSHE